MSPSAKLESRKTVSIWVTDVRAIAEALGLSPTPSQLVEIRLDGAGQGKVRIFLSETES